MTDFSVKYRASASISFTTLASLTDGSRADSSDYDNSTNRDVEASIKVKLTGSAPGNTGVVRVEIKRSHENTDFEDSGNTELLGTVLMNGASAVVAIFDGVRLSPHQKISLVNSSGAALAATGNSVDLVGIKYTDA